MHGDKCRCLKCNTAESHYYEDQGSIENKIPCVKEDYVNHPSHYKNSKAACPTCHERIECIQLVRHMGFNLGNVIKYVWRHEKKNGLEDLKKAAWYLNDEIAKLEK